MTAQPKEMIIFPLQVEHHSLIISVLQDGLKVKGLGKEQSHYGSMWLKKKFLEEATKIETT